MKGDIRNVSGNLLRIAGLEEEIFRAEVIVDA